MSKKCLDSMSFFFGLLAPCVQIVLGCQQIHDFLTRKVLTVGRGRTLGTGYAACLWLRTGIRVEVVLAEAQLPTNREAGDTVSIEELNYSFRLDSCGMEILSITC